MLVNIHDLAIKYFHPSEYIDPLIYISHMVKSKQKHIKEVSKTYPINLLNDLKRIADEKIEFHFNTKFMTYTCTADIFVMFENEMYLIGFVAILRNEQSNEKYIQVTGLLELKNEKTSILHEYSSYRECYDSRCSLIVTYCQIE